MQSKDDNDSKCCIMVDDLTLAWNCLVMSRHVDRGTVANCVLCTPQGRCGLDEQSGGADERVMHGTCLVLSVKVDPAGGLSVLCQTQT